MASWRTAQDLRQAHVDDSVLDEAEAAIDEGWRIDGDPGVRIVLSPITVEFGSATWTSTCGLLLTDGLLVFARKKGITHRLQVVQIPFAECPQYGKPTANGIHWRLRFDRERGGSVITYFRSFQEAAALTEYFANG